MFADFKAKNLSNPFRETVKDHKRYLAVIKAEKFEDALAGNTFKNETDLKGFIRWVLRVTPGYKP